MVINRWNLFPVGAGIVLVLNLLYIGAYSVIVRAVLNPNSSATMFPKYSENRQINDFLTSAFRQLWQIDQMYVRPNYWSSSRRQLTPQEWRDFKKALEREGQIEEGGNGGRRIPPNARVRTVWQMYWPV